jgi:hypothetical protein
VSDTRDGIVWQGDLRTVYLDPPRPPAKHNPLAYVPEQHASANCERAFKGGTRVAADPRGAWCDRCTTSKVEEATIRRSTTGQWKAA